MILHCGDCVTESAEDGRFHPIPHVQVETVDSIPVNVYRIWKIPPVWTFTISPQVHQNLIIRRPFKGNGECILVVDENSFSSLIDTSVKINNSWGGNCIVVAKIILQSCDI